MVALLLLQCHSITPLYTPPLPPSGMCVIGAIYCSAGCRLRVGVATPTVPSPLIWLLIKIIVRYIS